MAQTKEQILTKVTDFCKKCNFSFPAKSLEKFSEESVKLFDAENVKEEDVYSSLETQLTISHKISSTCLAEAAMNHKQEKTVLEAQIAELKKTQTQQITPQITPQEPQALPKDYKPDVAEALKTFGIDADALKELIKSKQTLEENEKIIAHSKAVIEKALSNVPNGHKTEFEKFAKFAQIQNTENIDNDAKILNDKFKEFIKDSDDIDIEYGGGGQDDKSKYPVISAAISRNARKKT